MLSSKTISTFFTYDMKCLNLSLLGGETILFVTETERLLRQTLRLVIIIHNIYRLVYAIFY